MNVRALGRKLLQKAQRPLSVQLDDFRAALGRQEARTVKSMRPARLADAEFKVYSQWGEDGIIQYLISRVPIADTAFIEFGVEDYSESNTRFLLVNDNWRGLILDGGDAHVEFAKSRGLAWRYQLDAKTAFVTPENVNRLFREAGFAGDIGLLSIDIDGNDYWVLEAIDAVSPRILIVEYNSTWGPDFAVTVPPDPEFDRSKAHHSNLYYGASVAAFEALARRKGFSLVGSNSAGNNLFFVRTDLVGEIPVLSAREAYVTSRFRESRDRRGGLTLVSDHRERLEVMAEMELVELTRNRRITIGELYNVR